MAMIWFLCLERKLSSFRSADHRAEPIKAHSGTVLALWCDLVILEEPSCSPHEKLVLVGRSYALDHIRGTLRALSPYLEIMIKRELDSTRLGGDLAH